MRALAKHWVREAVAVARQGALLARAASPSDSGVFHRARAPLTVFVHGYFAHGGVLKPLAEHLARSGVAPRQAHLSYAPTGRVSELADRLDALVRERNPGHDPVYIVGHSMGGLVARYYRQVLERPLARLVCLATPHAGTTVAHRFSALPLARELAPGSETLALLDRTKQRLDGTRVLSIVAGRDTMVTPVDSAALDGHPVVHMPELGHQGILFDREAWQHVEHALVAPDAHR